MGADHRPLVLLTGASGYIGGRLLKELEKAGWPVRCLARRPDFLRPRVAASTEVVKADCLDRSSLVPAMAGAHTAYYLVHSMGSPGKFEQEDREAAQNFADVARDSGVRRIVYLGGLGNQDQALSAHLRSRHEVADILRSSQIEAADGDTVSLLRYYLDDSAATVVDGMALARILGPRIGETAQ